VTTVVAGPAVTARCNEQIRSGQSFPGLCLKRTRLALGIPAKYPSAIAAWRAVPPAHRHPGLGPEGFPQFYNISKWGHITNSDGKSGVFTQLGARSLVTKVAWKFFARGLGWTSELNGVLIVSPHVPTKAAPTPPQHSTPVPAKPVKAAWHGAHYAGLLKIGSKGDAVKELQFHLGLKVTGKFTKLEAATVDQFVKARNKKYGRGKAGYLGIADGTAGPKTFRAITGHA
jgi:hypothetical protein